jgi:hypothetical protein
MMTDTAKQNMTPNNAGDEGTQSPIRLAQVLADELKHTRKVMIDSKDLEDVFRELHKQNLTALCFSGGGIRSATFGLGIVQALAKKGLLEKFDYLSTVSGGGYLGSWLSAWVLRERVRIGGADASGGLVAYDELAPTQAGLDPIEGTSEVAGIRDLDVDMVDPAVGIQEVQRQINCIPISGSSDPNPEPEQLQHLREYSNYMSPRVGLLSADTWALIGIYLRNLFLNLTIFVPLIAAVLLLPRLFYSTIYWQTFTSRNAAIAIVVSMLLAAGALAFVLSKLPGHLIKPARPRQNTDGWVVALGVMPLVLMAIILNSVGVSSIARTNALADYKNLLGRFDFLPTDINRSALYFIASAFIVCGIGYGIFAIARFLKSGSFASKFSFDPRSMFAALVAGSLWGILLWLVPPKVFDAERLAAAAAAGSPYYLIYVTLSVPLLLLLFLLSGTVYVGLSSGTTTDEDREWLARYGGWILIVGVVWIVLNGLVLLGPLMLEYLAGIDWTSPWEALQPIAVAVLGLVSGAASLIGGFSSKSLVRDQPTKTPGSRLLDILPRIAAVVFLGFIFVGLAYGTTLALRGSVPIFKSYGLSAPFVLSPAAQTHPEVLVHSSVVFLLFWFLLLAGIGVFMAFFVNVNKFSLHGAYRDRLVRAYLGASNRFRKMNTFTGFDDADNFQLHRLKSQKPLHIINATLNLVSGKQLAWQNRKAASFTMSPLHCGSWTLGFRRTNEYCRNINLGPCQKMSRCNRLEKDCDGVENCKLPGKAIRLGTAMAISGAAANPNMGYYSSSIVTFLMSLFNIRLGWWLGNTGDVGSKVDNFGRPFFSKQSPTVAVLPLLNETLGRTDENKRYINVTDGGHFENLGLYEMVMRRCKLIVLSDGAADADFKFGEIANAIQKCKVDLGVDIKFVGTMNIRGRVSKEEGETKRSRFAIAEIVYPERDANREQFRGWLIYTRPAYYGTSEPRDIVNYADSNERFPHQSTGDQMYDEKQFEAYRGLGLLTMTEIQRIFRATALGDPGHEVDDGLEDLMLDKPDLRRVLFEFFDLGNSDSYAPRTKDSGDRNN